MSSLLGQEISGFVKKPLFVLAHAEKGVGKTTFAASAPDCYFFDVEESTLSMPQVTRVSPKSFEDIMDTLVEMESLPVGSFKWKSLAFDSADRMEALIHKCVAQDYQKADINDIAYKQGFIYALEYWQKFVNLCKAIRDKHGTHIIILCHTVKKKFEDPIINSSYDRFEIKLHHKAADLLTELSELVLFARKDVAVKVDKGQAKGKAVNFDERFLHTQLHVAYDAKNRIGLPAKIPMPENGSFGILLDYYDKASGETPEQVYDQCCEAIKRILDEDIRKTMQDYVDQNKTNLNTLRQALDRILARTKEQ